MRRYRQPKAGTPDALKITEQKIKNDKIVPKYQRVGGILEKMKDIYRGDTSNEWQ